MDNAFTKRLLEGIKERLTSLDFRFIDNSLEYYSSQSQQAIDEDKRWFVENPVFNATAFISKNTKIIDAQILAKSYLYTLLADSHSKEMLVLVALYVILGHRFVKFPYYRPNALERRHALAQKYAIVESCESMRKKIHDDAFDIGWQLKKYSMPIHNEQVTLYTHPDFLYALETLPPYVYHYHNISFELADGDYAIDCGACFGDTALFFATKVGPSGKVLSFEPHPTIGQLYEYNRLCNPHLASRMKLITSATGDTPNSEIAFTLAGAGSSKCQAHETQLQHVTVPSTTLDAEIESRQWQKVDFIKMDIEGGELSALQGAVNIISKHRPKLAICLYHRAQDFHNIPSFLQSLQLGYRFYLEHHFVNNWETILYAIPSSTSGDI